MESLHQKTFRRFVALSLLIHFSLTAFIFFGADDRTNNSKESLTIDLVDATPPEKKQVKVTKKMVEDKKQVVDQDEKAINDELDEKARFLSAKNQKVAKQTVAMNRGDFRNRSSKSTKNGTGKDFQPMKVDDILPKMDYSKTYREMLALEKSKEKSLELAARENKDKQAHQQPTKQGTAGEEASQTIDYIKDLDPGLETMLSTREFVFYTYYSRIRRQLNQHWTPLVKDKITKIYREGRQIASSDDKITRCLVTLDKTGYLMRVQIIGNSGVRDLDEAAVEAFRAAAPFPNPPNGIIDNDGTIKIRWDFILEA